MSKRLVNIPVYARKADQRVQIDPAMKPTAWSGPDTGRVFIHGSRVSHVIWDGTTSPRQFATKALILL